jgi:fatty acid desaturase
MRESTNGPLAERQQADETIQPPTRPVPWIVRRISSEFGRRHVKSIAVIRLLAAIWQVTAGAALCASGHWWGALLFATAALTGSLAYLMPRWKDALDAENARTISG